MNWRRSFRMGLCLPMTEWFWNFKQAALTQRFVIPARRSASRDRKKRQAPNVLRSRIRLRVSGLDYPDISANFVVMAALEAAIQKIQGISSYDWMAGSSPVMTVGRKFANVFMASSASGNMGVIKFRDDGGDDPLPGLDAQKALRLAGMTNREAPLALSAALAWAEAESRDMAPSWRGCHTMRHG